MKADKENRYFKFTRSALKSYKKSDPLEKARNPRPSYFAGQWDINRAEGEWLLTIILMFWGFVLDIILLPFQVINSIFNAQKSDKTKFKAR